ncbi:hypothetical protein Tco_0152874 [Tanacetum coccineum]
MPSFNSSLQNVYKKHCHPKACGRSSIRCQKLPKEAQPHKEDTYRLIFTKGSLFNILQSQSLKGIWMKYLPQTIWRQSDRDKAGAMSRQFDNSLRPGGLCGAWRNLLVGDRTRETFTLQGTH